MSHHSLTMHTHKAGRFPRGNRRRNPHNHFFVYHFCLLFLLLFKETSILCLLLFDFKQIFASICNIFSLLFTHLKTLKKEKTQSRILICNTKNFLLSFTAASQTSEIQNNLNRNSHLGLISVQTVSGDFCSDLPLAHRNLECHAFLGGPETRTQKKNTESAKSAGR